MLMAPVVLRSSPDSAGCPDGIQRGRALVASRGEKENRERVSNFEGAFSMIASGDLDSRSQRSMQREKQYLKEACRALKSPALSTKSENLETRDARPGFGDAAMDSALGRTRRDIRIEMR